MQSLLDNLFMGSGYVSLQPASASNMNDLGVIPRVLTDLFVRIDNDRRSIGSKTRYAVKVSFLEIFLNEIRDLLSPKPANGVSSQPPQYPWGEKRNSSCWSVRD